MTTTAGRRLPAATRATDGPGRRSTNRSTSWSTDRSPSRQSASRGPNLDLVSELALVAVHLAVVLGFARLYRHGSDLGPLAAFVVVAHVLASVGRRRRIPTPTMVAVAVGGGVLLATWLLFPSTSAYGLPTPATWRAAGDAMDLAGERFRTVAAPVEAVAGFQLAAGVGLWVSVWFADWAAFRLRATAEAVAPAGVLFVFTSLLGSGSHRLVSAVVFAAAVLWFAASHRTLRAHLDQTWLAARPHQGPRAVWRTGIALGLGALAIGAAAAPILPGSGSGPLWRWRASVAGGGQRTTISPIVDLRSRLVSQSDTELFVVTADRPAYWRLTSLDRFDGRIWSSGGEFSPAGGNLPSGAAGVERGRRITQSIQVRSLSAIWAPVAYEARGVASSSAELRWDPESATLIVDSSSANSDGVTYDAVSQAPIYDAARLRRAEGADPADIVYRYLELPITFPGGAKAAALRVTANLTNRYDKARALQDWFRTEFEYSLEVRPGHDDDAMLAFLGAKKGYCEQFAGTYAAMARSLGIPARVAVGFTPGEVDPERSDTYVVRGRHAHAWPEVYFPEVGWVPFEPTPGRGMPDAESYTGAPAQQDDRRGTVTPETTASSTTTLPGGATPTTVADSRDQPRNGAVTTGTERTSATSSPWFVAGVVLLAAIAAWVVALLAAPTVLRLIRRERHHGRGGAVLDAWHDSLAPVRWTTALRPAPSETHFDFAGRAGPALGDLSEPFHELASLATRVAWDPKGATAPDAARAAELATHLRHEGRRRQRPTARIRRRLDWRESFDRYERPRRSEVDSKDTDSKDSDSNGRGSKDRDSKDRAAEVTPPRPTPPDGAGASGGGRTGRRGPRRPGATTG
jgi:transglutaminase-like putative cysteine protease